MDLVVGDYIDPATDRPRPGRHDHYSVVATDRRVRIARAPGGTGPKPPACKPCATEWDRESAAAHLDTPTDRLDHTARHWLRTLARQTNQDLGIHPAEQHDPACLTHSTPAYELSETHRRHPAQAIDASELGTRPPVGTRGAGPRPGPSTGTNAPSTHPRARPDRPRRRPTRSLANVATSGSRRRGGRCGRPVLLGHLNTAQTGHQRALELLPPTTTNTALPATTNSATSTPRPEVCPQALHHYQQSIQHERPATMSTGAGTTRYNIALLLAARAGPVTPSRTPGPPSTTTGHRTRRHPPSPADRATHPGPAAILARFWTQPLMLDVARAAGREGVV